MRNTVLHAALRDYYTQTLEALRRAYPTDEALPREVATRPRFDERNQLSYVQETSLDLLRLVFMTQIRDPSYTASYAAVEQAMRSDNAVARHLDTLVGTNGFSYRVDIQMCLRAFLGALLRDQNTLSFDEGRFQNICDAFENFFSGATLRLRFLAPLPHLEAEIDGIRLDECFALIRLGADERERYLAISGMLPGLGPGWRAMGFGWEKFALELTMEVPKVIGDAPTPGAIVPMQKASEHITEAISAFRLFKPGVVGYSMLQQTIIGWSPIGGTSFTWGEVPLGPPYMLSGAEAQQFETFWTQYREARSRTRPRIDLAIRRFNFGQERIRPEDRLTDYMIGLEALTTSREESGDLAYRIALRGSRLLGSDAAARLETHARLRQAYRLRSAIVHGSVIDETVSIQGRTVSFYEFVEQIAAYLREAIRVMMVRTTSVGEASAIASLDEEITKGG